MCLSCPAPCSRVYRCLRGSTFSLSFNLLLFDSPYLHLSFNAYILTCILVYETFISFLLYLRWQFFSLLLILLLVWQFIFPLHHVLSITNHYFCPICPLSHICSKNWFYLIFIFLQRLLNDSPKLAQMLKKLVDWNGRTLASMVNHHRQLIHSLIRSFLFSHTQSSHWSESCRMWASTGMNTVHSHSPQW